ncbi:hypothetical protein HK097_008956 [Rhizophlyctis rosea]|uniref:Uncharacterized protein n=1 Tax=Rhizophlyctis rosea TaxID=64517 RepID=A0AAD5SHY2_9FUNG|nr:hypothetical protein HK097_008956 [Rhizophlyctis rosea]
MAACRMIETIARETENPSHPMFVSKEEDRLESLNRLARHVFQALILSRLIVLEGIRNILPDLTPLCAHQWLLLQIFPSLGEAQIGIRKGRDLFLDVFNGTAIRFRNADLSFNFADLESELRGRLERVCRTYAVEHVLMVVDEAQILTHTMAQSFPSSSPTHSQRRPIITPLTTTCRSLESICLVYSGTGLLLSTLEKHIASAVLKSSSRIPTYVNFPCYDTFEKMRSFVNDRYKIGAADADIEYALSKLKGRARLLASCVESVLQKDSTLPEAVDSVFEAATDATRLGETSLVGQLDRIDTGKRPSFVKGINVGALLGRVIMSAQYFGDSPMFTGEHERFFVEVGFCRLKSYQSTLVAILDEPAAIVAGLKWLEKHAEERSDNTFQSTVTRMLAVMKGSPSTCGFLFEYFLLPVLPKIFNLVPVHPLLSNIDDLPARYTLPATLRNAGRYPIITRSSDKYTLKEWLEDSLVGKGSPFFRPEEPAGPDLVFVVENTNGLVIVFLQAKFGPGFTTMTMDTINPERFYHSRDTKPTILPHLKKRAKAVATLLKDHFGRDKRVVRMLTIFPLATPQHIYSHVVEAVPPEKRRTRAQRKAKDMPPDLILVVDKENMDEMVTAEHREFLEILQKLDQKGVK